MLLESNIGVEQKVSCRGFLTEEGEPSLAEASGEGGTQNQGVFKTAHGFISALAATLGCEHALDTLHGVLKEPKLR